MWLNVTIKDFNEIQAQDDVLGKYDYQGNHIYKQPRLHFRNITYTVTKLKYILDNM